MIQCSLGNKANIHISSNFYAAHHDSLIYMRRQQCHVQQVLHVNVHKYYLEPNFFPTVRNKIPSTQISIENLNLGMHGFENPSKISMSNYRQEISPKKCKVLR